MHLKSAVLSKIPDIVHGFGTRSEEIPSVVQPGWQELRPRWKQVHGVAVGEADACAKEVGEVDALWSATAGCPIGVVTADCVPVLMARRDGKAVASAHAGWRGTYGQILREVWKILQARGLGPASEWVAAIGPAIGPCCYEVSPELARDFALRFGASVAVPRERILDLPGVNALELRSIGLSEVDLIRECTRCKRGSDGEPVFHSYRRDGGGTRQISVISIG